MSESSEQAPRIGMTKPPVSTTELPLPPEEAVRELLARLQKRRPSSKYSLLVVAEDGTPLTTATEQSEICRLMLNTPKGRARCQAEYARTGLLVFGTGKADWYTCHAGLRYQARTVSQANKHICTVIGGQRWPQKNKGALQLALLASELGIERQLINQAAQATGVLEADDRTEVQANLLELATELGKVLKNLPSEAPQHPADSIPEAEFGSDMSVAQLRRQLHTYARDINRMYKAERKQLKQLEQTKLQLLQEQKRLRATIEEKALLYQKALKAIEQERLINELSIRERTALPIQEMVYTVLKELGQNLSAGRCLIYLMISPDSSPRTYEFTASGFQSGAGNSIDTVLFDKAVRLRQTIICLDPTKDTTLSSIPDLHAQLERLQTKALMVTPLIMLNEVIGALSVHRQASAPSWSTIDTALFESTAAQVAGAIQSARAFRSSQQQVQHLAKIDQIKTALIQILQEDLAVPLASFSRSSPSPRELSELVPQLRRARLTLNLMLQLGLAQPGQLNLDLRLIELQDLVTETLANLQTAPDTLQPHIELELDTATPALLLDSEKMKLVITSLLTDLLISTPQQGTARVASAIAGGKVWLRFIAEGSGKTNGDLDMIFGREDEEKNENSALPEHAAHLNLAAAKVIVGLHGGELLVDSEPGRDRCLTLTLPLTNSAPSPDKSPLTLQRGR